MTKILFSISLLFMASFGISQHLYFGNSKNELKIIESGESELQLENIFQQIDFEKVKLNSQNYFRMKSDGYSYSNSIGNPELPILKKLIEVPFGATITIDILESEYEEISLQSLNVLYPIAPKLSSVRKDKTLEFVLNSSTYTTNAYYNINAVSINVLGIMRDRRLARLEISPVSYNPVNGTLKICKRMKIRIHYSNYDTEENKRIKEIYGSVFFNGTQDGIIGSTSAKVQKSGNTSIAARYVIVSDTMFRKTLQPFIKWKQKKGYQVVEAYTNTPQVGKSNIQIKAYLKNLYDNATPNNPAPTFVLFVGDTAQLTVFKGLSETNHYTDLYFCEYSGDAFPEVLYGRFSATDTNQLRNQIEKTMEYEKYQITNPSFLSKSVLIAGVDNSYSVSHANPQISYANSYYFNSSNGITPSVYLYPNSLNASSNIIQDVNSGASIVNYTAHGSYLGWSNPAFSVSSVSGLTNTGKYPLMIGNACETGRFEQAVCFGESLVRAEKKGALAYIGASNNTYWDEDYYWSVGYKSVTTNPSYTSSNTGAYDRMFHTHAEAFSTWAMTNSQIIKAGNLAVTQSGDYILYYWEIYHLFGDPSLMVYQYLPGSQTVTYTSVIPIGLGNLNVVATPHSLVSISKNDSLIASAFADSLGYAQLSFDTQTPAGVYDLVVTAQNKIPFFSNLTIVNPNGPYLTVNSVEINDYQGNKNQKAENNETFSLKFDLKNLTNYNTTSLQLKIKSTDTNVVILDSIKPLTFMSGMATLQLDSLFLLKIKAGVKNNTQILFEIVISDQNNNHWNSYAYVMVYAPELEVLSYSFTDQNANGHIDFGETVNFNYSLKNSGNNSISMVQTNLTSNVNGLIISAGNLFDTIHQGESKQIQFSVQVPTGIWNGTAINFTFSASNGEYTSIHQNAKMVGNVDEDFETGNFQKYAWNNQSTSSWIITQSNVLQGTYSARSPLNLANSSSSTLSLELNVLSDDSIHFYRKVSSEEGYDFLSFFIDNIKMEEWSGVENWDKVSYAVKAGTHSFYWVYSKDGFGAEGEDAAYVDQISFPANDSYMGVSNTNDKNAFVSIFPNPASNQVNFYFHDIENSLLEIKIFDINGKLMMTDILSNTTNSDYHSMNISNLNSGIYTVIIQGGSFVKTLKLTCLE